MALTVGSRLGHYDVTALIGEGGMGQVYQATDTKLNRRDLKPANINVNINADVTATRVIPRAQDL